MRIIGVAGGSGSGKTSLVHAACRELGLDEVSVLELDAYYLGEEQMPKWLEGNYDHPEALDLNLFREHLGDLMLGNAIEKPVYDFASHQRTGYETFIPKELLILEGVLLFAIPGVLSSLTMSVFVACSEKERLARRLARDRGEERKRSDADIKRQFTETVQPMHELYVEPYRRRANVVIDTSTLDKAQAVAKLMDVLSARLVR